MVVTKERNSEYTESEIHQKLSINVYKSNAGFRLIFDGLKNNYSWILGPILLYLIIYISGVTITYYEKTWFLPGEDNAGYFEKIWWNTLSLLLIIILPFLKIFYNRLSVVFSNLYEQHLIDDSRYEINEYIEIVRESEHFISGNDRKYRYRHLFDGKNGLGYKCSLIFYIIGIAITTYLIASPFLVGSDAPETWNAPPHWAGYIFQSILLLFFYAYLLPAGMWHFMATIYCLRKIMSSLNNRNAIKLRPLAPDGVAGLRPLGNLSLSMIYVVVAPMIFIVTYLMFNKTLGIAGFIGLTAYLVIVIIIFFLPLSTTHDVMAREKENELQFLSDEFNRAYYEYRKETSKGEITPERQRAVDYMQKIGGLYEHVDNMAVWPFDISIMSKFAITIILPFLFIAGQILIERFI